MGTRSDIIVHCADDKWRRIYCHWDGYLSHNGKILFDHYTDQTKCDALVALGDMSSLGEEIGTKHPFERPSIGNKKAYEAHQRKYGNMCTAYGRDRGETGVEATVSETLAGCWPEAETWTEFTYVWDDGKWWVGDPDEGSQTLIDLGDALMGKKTLKPAVKAFGAVIGQHNAHDPSKPGTEGHSWSSHLK